MKRHILLTGAGFTKNFGGFLGEEMWGKIFGNPSIQKHERMRELLLSNCAYNFEFAYQNVLEGDYDDEQKADFRTALVGAYQLLDENILDKRPRYLYQLNRFFARFAGDEHKKGFIFTINQDLFIERFQEDLTTRFISPGTKDPFRDYNTRNVPLNQDQYETIPKAEISNTDRKKHLECGHSLYIKLHGSFHWKRPDGENLLIIGTRKSEDKDEYGLLRWYWELFESALNQEGTKLMIIGYGFKDKQLNEVLHRAIKDGAKNQEKLRVYMISPRSISETQKYISEQDYALHGSISSSFPDDFMGCLGGYFQEDIREIFLRNSTTQPNSVQRYIERCFWG